MGSVLFLAVGIAFGYAVCETVFPNFHKCGEKTYSGKELNLLSYFIRVPAWVLAGILPLTWMTYLSAYVLKVSGGVQYPLLPANCISMGLAAATTGLLLFLRGKKQGEKEKEGFTKRAVLIAELVFFAVLAVFFTELMFHTFRVAEGTLHVGYSVYSDFAPHMGMIRSFSFGNNFPTEYSHFAGEDIKYHFMFQFLVGNLEFLGLRIDYAFNLPSIFGLLATCSLLYALAAKLTGKRMVGVLTTVFFVFRSSPSFFRFLAEMPKEELSLKTILNQGSFTAYTPYENWGLWNINVYCNQRHLAFGMVVMLLALHFFLPYLYAMAVKLSAKRDGFEPLPKDAGKWKEIGQNLWNRLVVYVRTLFFTKTAFGVKHPVRALLLGILLGALAFFNGSVLIACCCMLFFMAAFSEYRLDYLITAVTALILSMLESKLFITGSAVSLQFFIGFIAENKTLYGMVYYMWQLWGVLLLFVGAYLLLGKGVKRYLAVVFSVPLVLAFTVFLISGIKVTPENMYLVEYYVTVNHKFVMIAEMLLSIFPAILLTKLVEKREVLRGGIVMRWLAVGVAVFVLTATGLFEYIIVRNQNKGTWKSALDNPITVWVDENTDSGDIFLTPPYTLHPVVLGGGMLYYGHSYYAQSAGYDVYPREDAVYDMYWARNSSLLMEQVQANGIDYIVVDNDARNDLYAKEDVIAATYEAVFSYGDTVIYDTSKVRVTE